MNLPSEQMSTGLLHKLYGVAVTALLPFVGAGLAASARGRRRIGERFGNWGPVGDVDWWFHGASVGEVQGLVPFIKLLRAEEKQHRLLLTATSPTGLDRGSSLVEEVRLLPIDAPFLVKKALRRVRAERLVVSETELWPTLLAEVLAENVPVHLINARISDYTYRWYHLTRSVFTPLLQRCASISVSDDDQRERFISLGVAPESIHVTGHTKYDATPSYAFEGARNEARQKFFPGIDGETPIVVLGSLREGEEGIWFSALKRVRDAGLVVRVILAPRHAERFEFFWKELKAHGQRAVRWSDGESSRRQGHDVLLLDSMGLLEQAYAAGDLAFVGATLVDIGGHNPFEPAMYRVPVVVGPYTSVIREPVSRMRSRGGIIEIASEDELVKILLRMCGKDPYLHSVGDAGYGVFAEHRGAAKRVLSVIRACEADRQRR